MAPDFPEPGERTEDDLHRAVRVVSRHFKTDTVFIIGSQSILLERPDAPAILRTSGEIDAYPGNIQAWEARHPEALASEEINALFGQGSRFHVAFGFYIDGVDEETAKFPPGWRNRASEKTVLDDGKTILVIAPCLDDLIVSKLQRLAPKDKEFIRACQQMQPLNLERIKQRLRNSSPRPETMTNAGEFLNSLRET